MKGILAAAHDGDVIPGPAAVRHELAALRLRRFPEGDFVELVEAVGFAALLTQQRAGLAARR